MQVKQSSIYFFDDKVINYRLLSESDYAVLSPNKGIMIIPVLASSK